MNWHAVLCCIAYALVSALTAPALGQTKDKQDDQGEAKRWAQLDALLKKSPKPKSIRAAFVQQRTSLLLDKPVVSKGRFVAAEKVARLSLTKPAPVEMRFDDKFMKIYYPKDNVLEVYNVPSNGIALTTGRPDTKRLAKAFTLRGLTTDKKSGLVTLALKPKGNMRKQLKSLALGFDPKLGLIVSAASVDTAGDKTTIAIKDIKPGAKVDPSELKLDVPDNARVEYPEGKPGKKED